MSIGIYISEGSRLAQEVPPTPASTFERLALRVTQAMRNGKKPNARGNVVAADYMVRALLKHGSLHTYAIIIRPWLKDGFKQTLKSYGIGHADLPVFTTEDIRVDGLDRCNLSAWFNPFPTESLTEGAELSQRVRSAYSNRVLPVTILFHGLSIHKMLLHFFFPLLLEESYACDSFILSSHASQAAMRSILDSVSASFGEAFGRSPAYHGRVDMIPLGIDVDRFTPGDTRAARRSFKIPQGAFVLLYLGALSPLKADLIPTLDMFVRLIDVVGPKVFLVIAGGDYYGYASFLREQIAARGLSKVVSVMVDLSDERKHQLLCSADVFLSPSDNMQESFGLTPIEAMACGVPQVVADWDGYKDTVEHGVTGFKAATYWAHCDGDLLDTGAACAWMFDHLALGQSVAIDQGEVLRYIEMLIKNPELKRSMSEASRKRAVSLYSDKVVVAQYETLWTHLAQVAAKLEKGSFPVKMMQPKYLEFFGHYPSHILSKSTELGIPAQYSGRSLPEVRFQSLPERMRGNYRIIDEGLINDILQCFSRHRKNGHTFPAHLTMGEVCQQVTKPGAKTDYVNRHIMWLIKYGYLQPTG
jgi:D-inositol-3-phosphate glycosyltransferase